MPFILKLKIYSKTLLPKGFMGQVEVQPKQIIMWILHTNGRAISQWKNDFLTSLEPWSDPDPRIYWAISLRFLVEIHIMICLVGPWFVILNPSANIVLVYFQAMQCWGQENGR